MAIPKKIRINREEHYRTHYIGKFDGKRMFMGFVVATLPFLHPADWQNHKRYYAVLHKFDEDGSHTGTEAWFAGVAAEGEDEVSLRAHHKLNEMIAALGKHRFGNVRVKLFSTQVDGQEFGLVKVVREEDGNDEVHLLPNDLVFCEPWDGEYDT